MCLFKFFCDGCCSELLCECDFEERDKSLSWIRIRISEIVDWNMMYEFNRKLYCKMCDNNIGHIGPSPGRDDNWIHLMRSQLMEAVEYHKLFLDEM